MSTFAAFDTLDAKVKFWRAGRACHWIESTVVSSGNIRFDNVVRLFNTKPLPIEPRLPAEILVIPKELLQFRFPLIFCTPSRETVPTYCGAMMTSPEMVVHPLRAPASP